LRVLDVDGDGKPVGSARDFAATPFHESTAALSRDGRWIAYESDEVDGVVQIYARSFPGGAQKIRISTGGARWPVWGANGDLFYWTTGEGVMHVAHTRGAGDELSVSGIEPVWPPNGTERPALRRMFVTVAGARFDVHPSGTRLLTLESPTAPAPPALSRPVIALDWGPAATVR